MQICAHKQTAISQAVNKQNKSDFYHFNMSHQSENTDCTQMKPKANKNNTHECDNIASYCIYSKIDHITNILRSVFE